MRHYAGRKNAALCKWSKGTQELHGLATGGAEHGLRNGCRRRWLGLRICLRRCRSVCKKFSRKRERSAAIGSEETEVTDLDEALWQDMLEEALDEVFDREGAEFELSSIGSAILKGNL